MLSIYCIFQYNDVVFFILILTLSSGYVVGQFGAFKQDSGYVTVRSGAHMFYWLFYTTADVEKYTDRPLVVWLQGGPGGSSTGIGNFEILGPLDLSLQERNTTWVKNYNVLFVDNPVGTGFSYVDELRLLTTTNDEIALDFVQLMRGFYNDHSEFNGVPLYIYGQSYGGKMAIDIGIRMHEAEKAGTIGSNLKGIAMGNAWISPVDNTLTWGPLLLAAGLVDKAGHDEIQVAARQAECLFNEGLYTESTTQWSDTQRVVLRRSDNVHFYNILRRRVSSTPINILSAFEYSREMMIRNAAPESPSESGKHTYNLNKLMNTLVKQALNIPAHVVWGLQSTPVFNHLRGDFMKPVTNGIEKLLNETDIILTKYNGTLDLICNTPGQILWVDRLKWPGAEGFKNAQRHPIWENDKLEGYYKSYGNFRFFWINDAGHNAPRDNPAGTNAILRDMIEADTPATNLFTVNLLEGKGIGDLDYTAAVTQIRTVGDIFWWFYPTIAIDNPHGRPLILWLDGVTGVPPSLLANLGMFGPYDINFNRRHNSWINRYNLLFIDAPLGTGFSTPLTNNQIPKTIDENAEHLALTLESFYTVHEAYKNTPLYIFGQAYGAQLALALAAKLHQNQNETNFNLRGVVLGNGIISPALAMTKLGFYLEKLGYIDGNGRDAIETLSGETMQLVQKEDLENAFDKFISLGQFVNDNAGAVAVNVGNIVEKLTREPSTQDIFGQREYLKIVFKNTDNNIMNSVVAPALGIPSTVTYDSGREAVIEAFRSSFMTPATDKVEYILQNTELTVTIYNGNLDAVSNTPGQLEWVDNLEWSGQSDFLAAPRQSLVVDGWVEGYFRNGKRLQFFWVNAAGQWAPLENPAALASILNRVVLQ